MRNQNNIFNKWRQGLAKTRKSTFGQISNIIGTSEIDEETWDDLEAMFFQSDMGVETTEGVINAVRERVQTEGLDKCK